MNKQKTMVALAKEYLAYRRNLGYQLRDQGAQLLDFAKYADKIGHQGSITVDLVVRWARLPKHASPVYWSKRVEAVRSFARHRATFDPKTEIPPNGIIGSAYRRTTPYIYSSKEIAELMEAARTLIPVDGLRPRSYKTLFGLLACTGIRFSEALRLTRDDVELEQGLLTIRETKFRKSRLVPLHPSATEALRRYAQFRDRYHPLTGSKAFFLSERGTPLNHSTVRQAFAKLRQMLGWNTRRGIRLPRIHDLRHTFACRRLLQWYREGVDVDHAISALSTYLGHVKVTFTYWYITGIPELLAVTTARFERFAHTNQGGM